MSEHDAIRDPSIRADRLHICPSCECPFVEPEALLGMTDHGLVLALYCGNCRWREIVVASASAFEQFDADLLAAGLAIQGDVDELELAAAEVDFERFAAALRVDAILPEDFGVPGRSASDR